VRKVFFFTKLSRHFGKQRGVRSLKLDYSQYYQEEQRGKIKLINFVIFHRNFFFLHVQIKLLADC